MGLRLPLQPGWAWLDKNTLEVDYDRAEMTATKALEFFLDALDADANSIHDFENFKEFVSNLKSPSEVHVNNVVPLKRLGIAKLSPGANSNVKCVAGLALRSQLPTFWAD